MIVSIIFALLLALGCSLLFNRALIALGPRLGLMDLPDARRVHATPIPRAGGLAIWVAFLLTAFGLSAVSPALLGNFRQDWLTPFALASLILVAVGVADDRRGVKPWWKLLGQAGAALAFFLLRPGSHGKLFGFDTPPWVDAVVFVGWAVLLINAFNLIDGLDGLCAGLAVIGLISLGSITAINGHTGAAVMMFLMVAAILGFIRYNRNPAKIFLGDTGSMLLGFFIASAATQTVGRRAVVGALLLPIAVAGVPLLDVMLAIWRRSFRNLIHQWTDREAVGVFAPDKDHLHHRFLEAGNGQRKVTKILHGLAAVLALLAFLPMIFGDRVIGISVVGLIILSLFGLRSVARIELVQSGSMLHLAIKRPSGNRRIRAALFGYDCCILVASAVAAVWFESQGFKRPPGPVETLQFTVIFTVLGVAALFLAKAYRRIWSRASIRDAAGLCLCVVMAGILTVTVVTFMQHDLAFSTASMGLRATFLSMLGLALPRCAVELLRELAVDAGHRRFEKSHTGEKHVVVYGGGDLGNLFLDYLKTCPPARFKDFRVVGFIDENPRLSRRILRGFPVVGGLDALDELAAEKDLHGVIVAISKPDEEQMARLREIAARRRLNIYSWCFDLTPSVMEVNRPAISAKTAAVAHEAVETDAELAR